MTIDPAILRRLTMESAITINGVSLTDAQSACVRCAIETFSSMLYDPEGLGADEVGMQLSGLYRARIEEIRKLLYLL
jgi:hypothetical protein